MPIKTGMDREESMSAKTYDGLHASYLLALQRCPNCNDEVFAAEGATLTSDGIVRFEWCCDLCGHKFETADNEKNSAWFDFTQ